MLLLLFILGTIFGSFGSVLLTRLENPTRKNIQSIFISRSHCPHCKHKLGPTQLIPILSYLIQKGKCKHCHTPIPIRYPLLEISCGIIFVLTYLALITLHTSAHLPLHLLIFWLTINRLLSLLTCYDLRKHLLHTPIRLLLTSFIILRYIFFPQTLLFLSSSRTGSGISGSFFMLHFSFFIPLIIRTGGFTVIYLIAKYYAQEKYQMNEGIGSGDIMHIATLSLLTPRIFHYHNLVTTAFNSLTLFFLLLFLAALIGLFHYGISKIALLNKGEYRGDKIASIAFLPSLTLAFYILLLRGPRSLEILIGR